MYSIIIIILYLLDMARSLLDIARATSSLQVLHEAASLQVLRGILCWTLAWSAAAGLNKPGLLLLVLICQVSAAGLNLPGLLLLVLIC